MCIKIKFHGAKEVPCGKTWTQQMQLYKCHIESYCVRVSGPRLFVSNEFVFVCILVSPPLCPARHLELYDKPGWKYILRFFLARQDIFPKRSRTTASERDTQ